MKKIIVKYMKMKKKLIKMLKYVYKNLFSNIAMFILILLGAIFKVLAAYKTGEAFNYILSYNFHFFLKIMGIAGLYFYYTY